MNSTAQWLTGLLLVGVSFASQAQTRPTTPAPKFYAELGYASIGLKYSEPGVVLKSDPGSLVGTLGYQLLPHLAIEGFAGVGLIKDDISWNGANTGVKAKISNSYGLMLKPSFRPSESLELFGRVGWAHSKASLSVPGFSVSDSDSDVAWGIGLNYHFSRTSYLQWSWMQHYDKDGLEARGWSLSYGWRF